MRWARYPQDHQAVICAVFGTARIDQDCSRLAPENRVYEHSTPWAKQFLNDLYTLAEADEEFAAWFPT
eukprot:7018408-Pyramimonas_sp.AAC.1